MNENWKWKTAQLHGALLFAAYLLVGNQPEPSMGMTDSTTKELKELHKELIAEYKIKMLDHKWNQPDLMG